MTDTAEIIEVIKTELTRRGDGVVTPIRIVTKYWTKTGELIATHDPCPDEDLTICLLREAIAALGGLETLDTICPELATQIHRQDGVIKKKMSDRKYTAYRCPQCRHEWQGSPRPEFSSFIGVGDEQ